MTYDFSEQLEKDTAKHKGSTAGKGSTADYFRVEEGNNNVCRIVIPAVSYAKWYDSKLKKPFTAYGKEKGDPRTQFMTEPGAAQPRFRKAISYLTYVIDRSDDKVKLAEFPFSVMKAISELQKNPDFAFDDLPMPYDIRITRKPDESPANKYSVSATLNKMPITVRESEAIDKLCTESPLEEIVKRKKEKQMRLDKEEGIWVDTAHTEAVVPVEKEEVPVAQPETTSEEINPDDIPF